MPDVKASLKETLVVLPSGQTDNVATRVFVSEDEVGPKA